MIQYNLNFDNFTSYSEDNFLISDSNKLSLTDFIHIEPILAPILIKVFFYDFYLIALKLFSLF